MQGEKSDQATILCKKGRWTIVAVLELKVGTYLKNKEQYVLTSAALELKVGTYLKK